MTMKTSIAALAAAGCFLALPANAQDSENQCGDITIAQMNWAAAVVTTEVAKFLLEQGYDCNVSLVKSDTVPAMTSVAENGEPDVITNLWPNSAGEAFTKLEEGGKLVRLANNIEPGGTEGWWIPTALAEEHPELTTIEGVMENPELVGGTFNNCPEGWGCRVVSDNLIRALDLESSGIEVFNHGSGETLASSMGSAVTAGKPWFGYYWGPTVPMGKYDMTRVKLGEVDEEKFAKLQNPDVENPEVSEFTAAPVLTAATAKLVEEKPEIAEFFRNMTFKTDTMSGLLAWQDENSATGEETAVHYLTENTAEWEGWLSDSAQEKLSALLKK